MTCARFGRAGLKHTTWGGASSGALVAIAAALEWTPRAIRELYDELARLARQFGVFGKMSIYHEIVLLRLPLCLVLVCLPDARAERLAAVPPILGMSSHASQSPESLRKVFPSSPSRLLSCDG